MKNKLKTLIIAGTMKGGTTALYDFIATHSEVLRGSKKEIHYFSLYNHLGDEWYLSHFDENKEGKKYIIDASPTYFDLVSSNMIPNLIKRYDKDAKVIIITRDPVSRSVSHLKHLQKVNKIKELVNLSPNDFFANDFTKSITRTSNIDYHLNQILFFSSYYRKSLIYKNEFSKDQLLFLSNDELKEKPDETMRKVFLFMGLEYEKNEIFNEIRHSNKSDIGDLNEGVYEKLATLLYPDYDSFCHSVKIENIRTPYTLSKDLYLENDVMIGKDGWLFLHGGSNEVFRYYTESSFFSEDKVEKWNDLLHQRRSKLKKMDIEYMHVFVPDKISVYPEYVHPSFKILSKSPINKLFSKYNEELNSFVLDPLPYFNSIKEKTKPLFWKTDSHWTFSGVFSTFQLILSKLNIEIPKYYTQKSLEGKELILDLGSKLSPVQKEIYVTVDFINNAKRVYANELVQYKEKNENIDISPFHVGSNVIFKNDNPDTIQKTVVIFGDSFSEYRLHQLTGLFAETFKEVHFVWSTSLDYNYIVDVNPDIVLSEIAERFMNTIVNDNFDLESYVSKVLKDNLEVK